MKLLCKLHKSNRTLSKALDYIAKDHPHLDMDDYLTVESLNSGIDEEVDDFMDNIQDIVLLERSSGQRPYM